MLTAFRLSVRSRLALLSAAIVLLVAAPALAQRGAIRGKIVDPDGNPVPDVAVSIVLADGGGRPIRVTTNDNGEFLRAGLRVETYRVSFERDGWEPLQAMVSVSNGSQAIINETLSPLPEGVLSQAQADAADGHLQMAQMAFQDGDYARAVAEFESFLEFLPDSAGGWFNLAAAREQMDDAAGAIEAYERAYELDAAMEDGLLAVADLHSKQQEWEAAMAAMDRVRPLVDSNPVHLFNYGVFAANLERLDVAAESYRKATEVDPSFSGAYIQLGMVSVRLEQNEAAIAAFESYLEVDPEGSQAEIAQDMLEALRQQPG